MAAEELLSKGVPVTHKFTELETEMYPSGLVEVWLEDETLLEDYEVRRKIEEVIGENPILPEDEDKIAAMPRVDIPERALFGKGRIRFLTGLAIVVSVSLLVWLIAWLAARGA